MHDVVVRPFAPEAWATFRDVRLTALRTDPGVFSSNHARESARTEEEWRARLTDPDVGTFAVVVGGEVVGMTGIYVDRADPRTASLWGSWLRPAWRGRGLSVPMYAARLAWARARPAVERVVVSHRASNQASGRANQKHGFVRVGAVDRDWPDGVREPEVLYELRLGRTLGDSTAGQGPP